MTEPFGLYTKISFSTNSRNRYSGHVFYCAVVVHVVKPIILRPFNSYPLNAFDHDMHGC